MQRDSKSGVIFDVKRFAIHDGPGIRTTFFFKGCPLRCCWCQNPEGMNPRRELLYRDNLCIHCGQCVAACPQGTHVISNGNHILTREKCRLDSFCVEKCPTKALEVAGCEMTVEQLMDIAVRDRLFYEKSGGGITLSGGEPMYQPAFARAVLAAAKSEGMHTAVDTSGYAPWTDFEQLLEIVDVFLYDVKDTDEQRHREHTGVGLKLIMDNLRRLDAAGAHLQLRCVIIPRVNDTPEHIASLSEIYHSLKHCVAMERLPYHTLGLAKWRALGKTAHTFS